LRRRRNCGGDADDADDERLVRGGGVDGDLWAALSLTWQWRRRRYLWWWWTYHGDRDVIYRLWRS